MVVITPGVAWTFMQEIPKIIEAMDPKGTTTVGRNAKVLNAVYETADTIGEAFKSPSIGDGLKIEKGSKGFDAGPKVPKGDPGVVPKRDPGGVPKGTIEGINKGVIGEWGNSGPLHIGSNKRDKVGAPNNRASLLSNYAYNKTDDSLFDWLGR